MCYQRIDVYYRLKFHFTSVGASVHGTDGRSIIATAPVAMTEASSLLSVRWRHSSAADRILSTIANRPNITCNRHRKSVGSNANVDAKVYCCKEQPTAKTNCRVHKSCAVQKSSLLMMAKQARTARKLKGSQYCQCLQTQFVSPCKRHKQQLVTNGHSSS